MKLAEEGGSSRSAADQSWDSSSIQPKQMIKNLLQRGGPLLLVLDDLWTKLQLTQLLGLDTRLPSGSQLLLTSRHIDVVALHNATSMELELLSDAPALALLVWHACRSTSLPAQLTKVAQTAVRMCGGLPVAIKVVGALLRRPAATKTDWEVRSCCL